jgi:hypothetical protein
MMSYEQGKRELQQGIRTRELKNVRMGGNGADYLQDGGDTWCDDNHIRRLICCSVESDSQAAKVIVGCA